MKQIVGFSILIWLRDLHLSLQWRHNERNGVSNHQPRACLLNRLFTRRSKETSKLCVTGLCGGNSPVTGEFPAQRASNAENVSIWWRHHDCPLRWSISSESCNNYFCCNVICYFYPNCQETWGSWTTLFHASYLFSTTEFACFKCHLKTIW